MRYSLHAVRLSRRRVGRRSRAAPIAWKQAWGPLGRRAHLGETPFPPVASGPRGMLSMMSEQPPPPGLALPYLIDALAQLQEATTRRAREHDEAEHQRAA